ncbi:MAG: fimbria/pilus periplasmic chaperone [Pseudomonadota bacterium]
MAALAPSSGASMVLSNVIVHFEPGDAPREDIEIENTGKEILYIEVTPYEILEPGTPNERRQKVRDPKVSGLLATPSRMVIGPGARKRLRLVNMTPDSEKERVYRVAVTPVVGELATKQNGLKVLIGYEVLVLTQPRYPLPDVKVKRDGNRLHFENQGNTNVLLRDGHQCANEEEAREDCVALASRRLYPGNRWELDLPYDRPVHFHLGTGTTNTARTYP